MSRMLLDEICYIEEKAEFKGWDFSHLKNRLISDHLPWNYIHIVKQILKPHYKILDMGTGGGEVLFSIGHNPKSTCVTESYEPNYKLCLEALAPLGIVVKKAIYDILPFDDDTFDVVINRHESYDLSEVYRVLKPNGTFITQQVGCEDQAPLNEILINTKVENCNFNLSNQLKYFEREGFTILYKDEFKGKAIFKDVGAIVYYAKTIPWMYPDFTVDNYKDELLNLQNIIERYGSFDSMEHRFIVIAKKT